MKLLSRPQLEKLPKDGRLGPCDCHAPGWVWVFDWSPSANPSCSAPVPQQLVRHGILSNFVLDMFTLGVRHLPVKPA